MPRLVDVLDVILTLVVPSRASPKSAKRPRKNTIDIIELNLKQPDGKYQHQNDMLCMQPDASKA